jgi:hypothetical protein|tara:strand:- start:1689 stop:2525 length:837 start_codon:yes stop_codon:yes gene_type:complete
MEYLTGHTIKPYVTEPSGEVIFTDGRSNEIRANQVQCQAYGYTYDPVSGTCRSFQYNTRINRDISNLNNKINGARNSTQLGSNLIQINGTENTTRGFNNNCLINGSSNEIANGVNNSTVFGTLGNATTNNSIVLGGNAPTDRLEERQSIQLMYGVQTTTGATVDSYLNNIENSYLLVPRNTVMYFHADVIAVRTGGTSAGSVGDYSSWVERGVISKIGDADLTVQRERDAIKSNGTTTLWRPTASVTGAETFIMQVRGAANTTIEWASTIRITQLQTS